MELKIRNVLDEKPVKLTVEVPASVFRDLETYAQAIARVNSEDGPVDPAKLIVPMITRFMASDRGFAKVRRRKAS
ncbi:hypothetical protein Geu3261_0196_013 [Komagataeibacter europaeus NBRC 3261]|nr:MULTISPECIES: DUF2274 domain-containing protein [Acetobacteraceae]GAN97534.1 hypothetical protein Geu3261_0196_013 [Komagataeibacter europaeus NBRC 3261]